MNDVGEFVTDNWLAISAAFGAILGLAGLIAAKTKTTVDDKVVSWLTRILGVVGGIFGKKVAK